MSSIVIELQREALNPESKLSDLLRKALLVSKKLSITDIVDWIKKELNGYENREEAPEYRIAYGQVKVEDPYRGVIPVIFKYSKNEELLSKMPFLNPIAKLEDLYRTSDDNTSIMMSYNPQFAKRMMNSINCSSPPVLEVQPSEIYRILDTVRNIVLNWALKLEDDGILGENLSFTEHEKETAAKIAYNINNFFGDVSQSAIQQNTSHSKQNIEITSDGLSNIGLLIDEIKKSLYDAEVDQATIDELKAELATLQSQIDSPKPKTRIINESLNSIKNIFEGAAGAALVQYSPQIIPLIEKIFA